MSKLFFTNVLRNFPYVFLRNNFFRKQNIVLLLPDSLLYYLALHLKLASSARNSQLVDIFAYESVKSQSTAATSFSTPSNPNIVYHFHNLFSQERVFIFASSTSSTRAVLPKTLGDLFFSAVWLEREVGEMHSV